MRIDLNLNPVVGGKVRVPILAKAIQNWVSGNGSS